ncbi:YggT family protein [Prochlorococcus sp. MIT 1307]|uniref:YggT family protein n=1 Tax=Prochlorococcus sp. MIT 1307 TaxID=3096219 RepID=UPI002A74D33D|nr:YggT family protein [Prochlorococcus sp. MIT 1307]
MTSALIRYLPTFHLLLGLLLSSLTLAFLIRIILTWYPQVNLKKGLWIVLVFVTEPILSVTRKVVSPIGGVDVTPVIWVGFISLIRELLVGQQGVLSQILLKTQALT